jgi:hypothetical protein
MCFGGGSSRPKSAEEFYRERKPSFGALPSLKQSDKVERKPQEMKDVVKAERVGQKRRSLLYPTGGE